MLTGSPPEREDSTDDLTPESPWVGRVEKTLRAELADRRRRVLSELTDWFDCAVELVETHSEELTRRHRELANLKARIKSGEARQSEISQLRSEVRERAAGELVERNEETVKELQARYEALGSDLESCIKELKDLRARVRAFAGTPGSSEELQRAISGGADGLRREADRLLRTIEREIKHGKRELT